MTPTPLDEAHSAARPKAWRVAIASVLGIGFALPLAVTAQQLTATEHASSPWRWAGVAKVDGVAVDGHARPVWLGNLGLSLDADLGAQLGWSNTTFHAESLWNAGGKPNHWLSTLQGLDNIEVERAAARLYATWLERELPESGTRVLAGLYDLNTEFYATDASGMLLHPSFGIGPDFSQSGRNGPSIFPNVGLALRVKQSLGESHYLQVAAIDGVPGDPARLGRTEIHLSRADGALFVAEFGWQQHDDKGPLPGHWGLGAWHYTAPSTSLTSGQAAHNQGAYVLAQALLHEGPMARTIAFLRWGSARSQINRLASALEIGALVDQPWGERGPEALTAGFALGRLGAAYRADPAQGGGITAEHETTLEVGARSPLAEGVSVQPYFQHVLNPGGVSGETARVAGVRLQWNFGADAK